MYSVVVCIVCRYTGVLTTTIDLDYDLVTTDRFPTLNVSVNDTEFIAFLTVNVEVVDINDNSPVFDNDTYRYSEYNCLVRTLALTLLHFLYCYRFDVEENSASGTIIGQVQATDNDSGTFGQIIYTIYGPPEVTSR